MSCLGVLFAIDEQMMLKLKAEPKDEVVDFLKEEIEDVFFDRFPDHKAELAQAWDPIHRAFSDSKMEVEKTGEYPLSPKNRKS